MKKEEGEDLSNILTHVLYTCCITRFSIGEESEQKKMRDQSLCHFPFSLQRAYTLAVAIIIGVVTYLGCAVSPTFAAPATVVPGTTWKDNNGNQIQAHGGGMILVGSTYYWFGEDKHGESLSNAFFQNVPCYSSTDLVHWTFVNNVLTEQASGDLGPNRIIERPKVVYNSTTSQYVMYMHVDNADYSAAMVGVATSSTVCGNYSYRGSFQPLGFQSRDMGLFQDTDGTGYLLSEDRVNGLRIDKLSADYLSVVSSVAVLADYEAPAMFKYNGNYYLLGSHLSGWNTNDNQYTSASSLAGPWASWANFAPSGTHTFNSQTTFVLPIKGSQTTTFIYMGDRWAPASLGTSPYIWQPLQFNGNSFSVAWNDSWSIDISTGASQPLGTVYYKVVNLHSGEVLDAPDAAASSAIQAVDSGITSQQWSLAISGSNYQLVNHNSGKVLDVSGASTTAGAGVIQWVNNGGDNQKWNLVMVSGGYYKLVNVHSSLVLDVSGASTTPGTGIIQWTDKGAANQQWSLIPV